MVLLRVRAAGAITALLKDAINPALHRLPKGRRFHHGVVRQHTMVATCLCHTKLAMTGDM